MELYELLHILFFPGIVLHESAHAIACLFLGVPIKKIKFLGKKGGYVVHGDSTACNIIIITFFPFVFNIVISLVCARVYLLTGISFLKLLMAWVGISALLFCVPSNKDAKNAFEAIKRVYTKKQDILSILLLIVFSPLAIAVALLFLAFVVLDKYLVLRLFLVIAWVFLFMV